MGGAPGLMLVLRRGRWKAGPTDRCVLQELPKEILTCVTLEAIKVCPCKNSASIETTQTLFKTISVAERRTVVSVVKYTQISMKMKANGHTSDDLGWEPETSQVEARALAVGMWETERLVAFPSCTCSAHLPSILLPIVRIS